jgi:hypothetical protein
VLGISAIKKRKIILRERFLWFSLAFLIGEMIFLNKKTTTDKAL